MDKLKNACRQSCEDWADSFDDEQKYEFSSAFESRMEKLQDETGAKKHRFQSKKATAFLVNVAVIVCFCAAMFVIPPTREKLLGIFRDDVYDLGIGTGVDEDAAVDETTIIDYNTTVRGNEHYTGYYSGGLPDDDRSDFHFGDDSEEIPGKPDFADNHINIELNYIPDGYIYQYVSTGSSDDTVKSATHYYKNGEAFFEISKNESESYYNGEDCENVLLNGVNYAVINEDNIIKIFWNSKSAYYMIKGNIDREELLKIASNAQ